MDGVGDTKPQVSQRAAQAAEHKSDEPQRAGQVPEHALLRVSEQLAIPLAQLSYRATRSGGPGGQHVNTSSTRVEVEFDVGASPALTDAQRALLLERLQSRLRGDGVLRLASSKHRSQHQNREDVTQRLARVLAAALHERKPRRATKVPRGQKEQRLRSKKQRSQVKKNRAPVRSDE
jgi:ribosome-associated protein